MNLNLIPEFDPANCLKNLAKEINFKNLAKGIIPLKLLFFAQFVSQAAHN